MDKAGNSTARLLFGVAAGLALSMVALCVLTASASGIGRVEGEGWIVVSSNRDGKERVYSLAEDGTRLSPLLPRKPRLQAVAVSPDGNTIAYSADFDALAPLYVARADGSGLRRLGRKGIDPAFSPNGKLLAFVSRDGIWVVRSDGRGLRRATSGDDATFSWSPDGKALVVMRVITHGDFSERFAVVVQPLRGKGRIIVRTGPNDEATAGEYQPQWSPNGRWIAYVNLENAQRRRGLTLVRPNGKDRHRAVLGADEEMAFRWSPDGRWLALMEGFELDYVLPSGAWHRISAHASGPPSWSPDGKKLAFPFYREQGEDIAIASGNGWKPKLLHLGVGSVSEQALVWSPDGRWIAFGGSAGGDPLQAWIVGADGRGLRRLTSEGDNHPVSWTRLAPVLPPAAPIPPGEQVVAADTVATTSPITALAADGQSVVFASTPTATDCTHVVAWKPGQGLSRLGHLPAPCPRRAAPRVTPLVLAGSRAAWVTSVLESGDECYFSLESATLSEPVPRWVSGTGDGGPTEGSACKSLDLDHLRGDGDLVAFNDEPGHKSWLRTLGTGREKCGELRCATLRKDGLGAPVDSVSERLIGIRKPATVRVFDDRGRPLRTLPFTPADVSAARIDGSHLVVSRSDTIESYDLANGSREQSRPLPAGYQLVDVDGGIAVLRRSATVILVRLGDAASISLTPGRGPLLADLELPGLYYSYAGADGSGRIRFLARSELLRRLGGVS